MSSKAAKESTKSSFSADTISATFDCEDCSTSFESASKLQNHYLDRHASSCVVSFVNSTGVLESTTLTRLNGDLICPRCSKSLKSKSGLRKHLDNNICKTNEKRMTDEKEDESKTSLDPVTVPTIFSPSSPRAEVRSLPKRGYDETALAACQHLHASDEDKAKALLVIRHLELKPFTLKDYLGKEQCALTNSTSLERLTSHSSDIFTAIAPDPKKRKLATNLCENCSLTPTNGLENLLSSSPYADVLQTRSFLQLNDQHCKLLNKEWTFHPNLRYVCARLLAGCILLNTSNGQAVMANTVEVYGRNRRLDIHREHLISKKGEAVQTSLPPSTGLRYEDVWPLTIVSSDGERLLIGTQSCNILVTSSLRLDVKQLPSLGGSTVLFRLSTESASSATQIFLDQASVKCALELNSDDKTWSVQSQDQMSELRQLRTKFHDASTFMLCRASGHFARHRACQPYTVFNLATCDRFRAGGKGVAAAIIFNEVAQEVLRRGADGCLRRAIVDEVRQQCGDGGRIANALDNILGLFKSDSSPLIIVGNTLLNTELEDLANEMSALLVKANEYSAKFIEQSFTSKSLNWS